ncbi:hypothetical protein, conserved [Trypanosoma cruzi]|uniref:Uncharacterized protein n=1 Tax=Trypanosoma cruzi (strain CL Brener) TaxID=353153 RepID=Q4DL44_TRYCC|nr:hypothetical protein, conserved [Trypanosoma cruzi]EAN93235.1 hypothetical protein, conserved [Trypanosoma cruzi]|eukprot:XP_815086.1 hypothetical protein [Trypanosoma cruzi strain CL Brener]
MAQQGGNIRRGSSRSNVHPAYGAMVQTEKFTRDDSTETFEGCNIQVQVRTRENGRRSPLVATPTHRSQKSSVVPLNSYGSEENSPPIATPIAFRGPQEFPAVFNPQALLQEPLPPTVVHRGLYGKCRFILFPLLSAFEVLPPPPAGKSFPLFVGQVRFETTPAELIWLFRRTSGACAITIEGRGNGCFIVHLQSESERSLVRQLHRRVLFDIGGVWFARSSEEVDSLCEYVALNGPYLSKQAKLPRDSMVVEDIKVELKDMAFCHPCYYSQEAVAQSFWSSSGVAWDSSNSRRETPTKTPYCSPPTSPLAASLTMPYSNMRPQDVYQTCTPPNSLRREIEGARTEL